MQAIYRLFWLLLFSAIAAGCVSTNAAKLTNEKFPSVKPDQVQVFLKEEDVKQPFQKIAILEAKGNYNIDKAAFIKSLQKRAGKLGANGIILGNYTEATTGAKVSSALLGTSANDKREAIAIRLR